MFKTFHCPKCNRLLRSSGELTIDAESDQKRVVSVFQCDECLVSAEMFGETTEVALTFAVGEDGQPFDPATEDGELPL